jgi:hypothetical protein
MVIFVVMDTRKIATGGDFFQMIFFGGAPKRVTAARRARSRCVMMTGTKKAGPREQPRLVMG